MKQKKIIHKFMNDIIKFVNNYNFDFEVEKLLHFINKKISINYFIDNVEDIQKKYSLYKNEIQKKVLNFKF